MARFVAMGHAAVRALRAGAKRGFPITPAQLARDSRPTAATNTETFPQIESGGVSLVPYAGPRDDSLMRPARVPFRESSCLVREQDQANQRTPAQFMASRGNEQTQRVISLLPAPEERLGLALRPIPHSCPALRSFDAQDGDDPKFAMRAVHSKRCGCLGPELDQLWGKMSDVLMHNHCRPIDSQTQSQPCIRIGMCVCSGRGKTVDTIWRRVARAFRELFLLNSRPLLTEAHVGLQRIAVAAEVDAGAGEDATVPADRWCNVALIRFKPLSTTVLELENPPPQSRHGDSPVTEREIPTGGRS